MAQQKKGDFQTLALNPPNPTLRNGGVRAFQFTKGGRRCRPFKKLILSHIFRWTQGVWYLWQCQRGKTNIEYWAKKFESWSLLLILSCVQRRMGRAFKEDERPTSNIQRPTSNEETSWEAGGKEHGKEVGGQCSIQARPSKRQIWSKWRHRPAESHTRDR